MSDAFVEKRYIEEYTINNKYQFTGADVFSYQDRNLLLNSRLRTSILIDDFCLRQIENNHIGDDLMFKLHQRDLIRLYLKNRFICAKWRKKQRKQQGGQKQRRNHRVCHSE